MLKNRFAFALAGVGFLFGLTSTSSAALIAYEGFEDISGQELTGQSGGAGFTGPWTSDSYRTITSPGLTYPSLSTSGNAVSRPSTAAVDTGAARAMQSPFGTNGTTVYVSVLLRPDGTLDQGADFGYFGIGFYTGSAANGVFFGKPGTSLNDWVVSNGNGTQNTSTGVPTVIGETDLVILKAQFSASGDIFTLFVNPSPNQPEPAFGTTLSTSSIGSTSILSVVGPGACTFDEIRVGTTFADVTPVPEPASLVAVSWPLVALLRNRRPLRSIA